MPEGSPGRRRDTLGLRLALAFLAVALAAVALLAGLAAAFVSADVSSLASGQRAELASAVAVAAGTAWDRNDSWASADLSPLLDRPREAAWTSRSATRRAVPWHPRPASPRARHRLRAPPS